MLKLKTIQNFAFQYDLWEKGSKIIVGVSGGADSACLTDVLSALSKKYDFQLHIAHVNYGLRGEDSQQDELFVRKLGEKYGIKASVLKLKKTKNKGNLENNLRNIRYDFFENLRRELEFDLVAVAHNSDDQAETVLMRIIRGSGLSGLSAMRPKNGKVVRPLLATSRREILAFLKEKKLKYRVDKSNFDKNFVRNNIRHKLLPYLEKNFNPAIRKTLSGGSIMVADDYDFILRQAERFTKGICKTKCAHFDSKTFLCQHASIQRQVLRNIFHNLKKGTENIESQHIEELIKVVKSDKSKTKKACVGGLNILKKGDNIEIFC